MASVEMCSYDDVTRLMETVQTVKGLTRSQATSFVLGMVTYLIPVAEINDMISYLEKGVK